MSTSFTWPGYDVDYQCMRSCAGVLRHSLTALWFWRCRCKRSVAAVSRRGERSYLALDRSIVQSVVIKTIVPLPGVLVSLFPSSSLSSSPGSASDQVLAQKPLREDVVLFISPSGSCKYRYLRHRRRHHRRRHLVIVIVVVVIVIETEISAVRLC